MFSVHFKVAWCIVDIMFHNAILESSWIWTCLVSPSILFHKVVIVFCFFQHTPTLLNFYSLMTES